MVQNKYEALLNDFQPGNRGTALETQVRLLRGYAFAALKNTDAALKEFAEAAALSPKDARPLSGTARVYLNENKRTEAEAELKRAIEINPQSAETLSLLGELNRTGGNADKALEYFDLALAQGSAQPDRADRTGHDPARSRRGRQGRPRHQAPDRDRTAQSPRPLSASALAGPAQEGQRGAGDVAEATCTDQLRTGDLSAVGPAVSAKSGRARRSRDSNAISIWRRPTCGGASCWPAPI
ncbi:MAG: tetratricopeptide repeat protein [Pseudomonadota bacterium]